MGPITAVMMMGLLIVVMEAIVQIYAKQLKKVKILVEKSRSPDKMPLNLVERTQQQRGMMGALTQVIPPHMVVVHIIDVNR